MGKMIKYLMWVLCYIIQLWNDLHNALSEWLKDNWFIVFGG